MNQKIRATGCGVLVAIWILLTAFAWFGPRQDISESERRPLEQMPQISAETLLNGKFMTKFEEFTLDQFPQRDSFRRLKSLFHFYALNQGDNNGIYIADGYAAKLEYPMNQTSMDYAVKKFNDIYRNNIQRSGCKVYFAVAPDKGYYLSEKNGYPAMDYASMISQFQTGMPWATYVDLTDCLSEEDYYFTDTHWRQEKLLPVAQKLCQAMKVTAPKAEDYTVTKLERPFYGVYYGQAALPMDPEPMYILENEMLAGCTVFDYEDGSKTPVYNMAMQESKDLYDVYLSGAKSLLRIDNPKAKTNRELIVFRDSFGSSIIPLLVQDYRTVTVVDIRYLNSAMLKNYIRFRNQDVLFLYSTLVLNNSSTLN